MKIIRTYPFWIWLCRLAYKQIRKQPVFTGLGVPGIRDKENPCPEYSPKPRRVNFAQANCETDGHYLCKECIFRQIEN